MAEIITLNISDDFKEKVTAADSEVKKLVTTTKDARDKIIQYFKDMGNLGVDEFIKKIKLAQEAMKMLGSSGVKTNPFGPFSGEASKAADAANKLIEALLKISNANLERIAKNKELQEMHAILNARRKEAAEYKKQQAQIKAIDNEAKQRKRELTQQDKDNANQARITSERRKNATEKEIQALRREQSQLKLNEATFKSYTQAMLMSEVSNNARIKKIERLKTVLEEMRKEEHKYGSEIEMTKRKISALERENRKVEESVKRVQKSKRKLMDTVGQLQRSLALLFSVSQIIGYFNKMVSIRKEMELQQKSLQILLQNKDEADKLWNNVIDLAVQSPFRVKELVTYTKQLAAYRIESDKLFDTTKRLSDVAAGLGVDMNRLILAYGQIRAAGFLRGTELRQLTEAGIPMLDELAKYLTEVEGRAISTGDVFGMISKRMVSFEDVAEVFRRMTNEGGVFFNMQEEQAKTLHGAISNLHDSIDLMLNDIGRVHDAKLKGGVQTLRELVANWREVAAAMNFLLTIFSPFIAYSILARVANSNLAASLLNLVKSTTITSAALNRFNAYIRLVGRNSKLVAGLLNILKTALGGLATLGVGLAITAIVTAITKLYLSATKASRAANELDRNLKNLVNEDVSNLDKKIDGFRNLTTRLGETNEKSAEHRDIISRLNSEYGEYLDFVVEEDTKMQDLADSYEKVVKRMKEKASLATMEKGLQAISDSYGKSLEDATIDFYKMLEGASIKKEGDDWGLSSITPTKKEIEDIFNLVQTRIREADKEAIDGLHEQQQLIQDVIKGYYGDEFFLSRDYAQGIELIEIMVDKKQEEEELQKRINREYKETLKSREANLAFEKLENEYNLKKRKIEATENLSDFEVKKQLADAQQQFELDKIELKLEFGEISQESADKAKDRIINWASDTVKEVNNKIREELSLSFSEEEYSQILITQEEYGKGLSAIIENTTQGWEIANQIIAEQISLKSEGLPIDEDVLKNAEKQAKLYKKRAEYLGIELDYVKKIDKASVDSINSQLDEKYQISLEDSYKSVMQLQEQANNKRQEAIALEAALNLQRERGVAINEEELAQIKADVEGWTKLWKLLGGQEKEKGSGGSSKNSLYDERIKVIDDMNKKYQELNKTLGESEALQGAFEAYIDAFAEAYKGIKWIPSNVKEMTPQEFATKVLNFPNENALVSFLDKLANEPMKAFEKIKVELAKGEYVYDMKVRAKSEDDKLLIEKIEDMFSGYELSLELEKLNIPKDLAKQLFNVDSVDLSSIRSKIESDLAKARSLGGQEDLIKELEKQLKKVDELESKAQMERLKRFADFLVETADEIANIQNQGAFDIAYAKDLFLQGKIDAEQYSTIIKNIVNDVNSNISKINLEKFKESPEYIAAMGDMAAYTSRELDNLSAKIRENISKNASNMGVDEIEAYNNALAKIVNQQNKLKSPFGKSWLSEIKEIKQLEKGINDEKEKQARLQNTLKEQQKELLSLQQKLQELQGGKQTDKTKTQIATVAEQINTVQQGIADTNGEINTTAGNISNMGTKLSTLLQGMGSSIAIVDKIVKNISQGIEATIQIFNDTKTMMDSFGVNVESASWQDMTLAMETLGNMNQKATQGWEDLKSGNVAGAVANTIGVVTSLITGLNKIHDAKYERRIQNEIKFVEDLERAYEKLEKAIDDAYSIDTLQASGKAAKANLESQIDSYEKMIAAEEDKKDTDKDRIKEWELQIEEIREQVEEMNESLVSTATAGIMDSVLSASQEFTDAWLEAFNETGDGLSGLSDNFKSTMLEMVKQQAAMLISQSYVEKWKKQLEQYINPNDLELSTEEAKRWVDAVSSSLPQLNDALENYFTAMQQAGVDLDGGTSGELSGLQRGIQGVTEETAQIIEAYLNSIRFFVAEQNTLLSRVADAFTGEGVENPMIGQLRIIAQQTTAINTLLQSLTRGGHSLGGVGLKVFLS